MSYIVRCQDAAGNTCDVHVQARSQERACRLATQRLGAGWLAIWALED
jgi:hypothetical protein